MFVDHVEIVARAGSGGRGAVAFRREKYVPFGGPSGGDGGRGGSVWARGDPGLATLLSFHHRHSFQAADGASGASKNRHGAGAPDVELAVPLGTEIHDAASGAVVADVLRADQRVLIARGGDGGRGNARFKSSVRQAPRFSELGEPGEERRLALELRVLADVGLVGMPNAGKSTLLAAVSAARPKIAPYPFTTLEPQLGVVRRGEREFVMADIPGLIEGAHAGHGLGNEFLRHVDRCRLLVHLVDGAAVEGRDPVSDFQAVERELRLHSPGLAARPRVLVANKSDLDGFAEHWERLRGGAAGVEAVLAVSAAARQGIEALVEWLFTRLAELPPRYAAEDPTPPEVLVTARGLLSASRGDDGVFVVSGRGLDRLVRMADLENPEAVDYLFGRMLRLGVPARLRQAGAKPGDRARIGAWAFSVGEAGTPTPDGFADASGEDAAEEDSESDAEETPTGAGDGEEDDRAAQGPPAAGVPGPRAPGSGRGGGR